MIELVWFIAGIFFGGVTVWFIVRLQTRSQGKSTQADLTLAQEQKQMIIHQLEEAKEELKKERETVITLNNRLASTEADYRNLQEKLADQKKEIAELQNRFTLEFKNIASEILEEKSKKFTDQNKHNLHDLLNPLKEKITEFEKKVDQNNKEHIDRNAAMRQELKNLRDLNLQMTKEAENLTKALKGDTKTQGNWGEFILESILEKSGLEKGREYFVQESFTTEEGKRYQPDVIIRLPENKNIVVDSKVSLVAYEKLVNAGEESAQQEELKAHIQSIRNHFKGLSKKNYQDLYGVKGLDFVLMFIPIEPAFGLAVQNDPALFNDAYSKNIVIVSPSTLIATLRTIANIWKNEYQNRNAMEIARQGGTLYDKFKAFADDLIKVGENLRTTTKNYESAMNKLTEGRDNLVRKAERLRELGAKTGKSVDQRLLDRAE